MERNTPGIPTPTRLPESDFAIIYIFVDNDTFGLHKNLLRTYFGIYSQVNKRIFNNQLPNAMLNVRLIFVQINRKYYIGNNRYVVYILRI